MRTSRGAKACAAAVLVATTLAVAAPTAAAAEPPAAPYTALMAHFEGWGYLDGSFSYEPSRTTLEVYQQTANDYALVMRGFRADHWHNVDVTPPIGTRFEAGRSYPTNSSFHPSDSITVLNVSGDGQGCDQAAATSGTLNVREAAYDEATGRFTAFAADYSVRCSGLDKTARGEIRFRSGLGYRAVDSPDYRLQFGRQPWGGEGAPLEVPVEVTGTLPTTFGAAALTGANPTAFRVTADTCSGRTLTYGQRCALTVTPTATAIGAQTAELTLPEDSLGGRVRRLLSLEGFDALGDRGTYYPLTPTRVLDTRSGQGAPRAAVGSGQTLRLQVTGRAGVPAEASTVVLNVTVTEPTGPGHVSVYPTGVTRPTVSSLNYSPGWTGANSVTVKVGADGAVNLYNNGAPVHLIADVNGYYSQGRPSYQGGQYHPLANPVRLADTREWGIGRLPADYYVTVSASWDDDAINRSVRAFAVNITATETRAPGYLTAWNGYGPGLPNTSTLNYATNATATNFAVVPSIPCADCGSATGAPSIGVYTSQDTHVIVDIVGFYDDGTLPGGLRFEPVVPSRITDTRAGQGWPSALGPATTATIAAPGSIAGPDTWALATNVTAVQPTSATYLTVWPAELEGAERPGTSNLNPAAGAIVPNAVQTMIGSENRFHVYNNVGRTHLLVDVVGSFYYVSRPTAAASGSSAGAKRVQPASPSPKAQPLNRPNPA
ncbi:hypothetical protein ACIGNX_33015 [Actinosynnema sp. NPDC053489]|uniref:hypothetical protein n=1 Tax=Actinosynnema sp. NPDC053489 TaxID=3363916 RepID=UPI0037CB2530